MEIFYIINSAGFLTGDFGLAAYLARKADAVLVGVVLEDLDWAEVPLIRSAPNQIRIDYRISTALPENERKRAMALEKITRFREACASAEVRYRLRIHRGKPLRGLVCESRYADVLVLDPAFSPDGKAGKIPTDFVEGALTGAECPVIVAGGPWERINQLVFAYDGSRGSVYALKQFSYLFPGFRNTPVIVIEVRADVENSTVEKRWLHHWLNTRYSNVKLITPHGRSSDQLIQYLTGVDDAMAIMSGFSRSVLSRILSPSVSRSIVRTINLPVFIAHPPQ